MRDLMFADVVIDGDNFWFFNNKMQALCRLNIESHKVQIKALYEGTEYFSSNKIFNFGRKIYITSNASTRILAYDKDVRNIVEIINPNELILKTNNNGFVYTFLFEDCIWMIPHCIAKPIYCFDLNAEKFYEEITLYSQLKNYVDEQHMYITFANYAEEVFWAVIQGTRYYMKFDLLSKKIITFGVSERNTQLNGICCENSRIWLTQQNSNSIWCIDDIIRKIDIDNEIEEPYSNLVCLSDYIIALPRYGNNIVMIDRSNLSTQIISIQKYIVNPMREKYSKIIGCCEINDNIFLFPWGITELLIFNKKTLNLEKVDLIYDKDELLQMYLKRNILVFDDEYLQIVDYVDFVLNYDFEETKCLESELTCGEKIYHSVLDLELKNMGMIR